MCLNVILYGIIFCVACVVCIGIGAPFLLGPLLVFLVFKLVMKLLHLD